MLEPPFQSSSLLRNIAGFCLLFPLMQQSWSLTPSSSSFLQASPSSNFYCCTSSVYERRRMQQSQNVCLQQPSPRWQLHNYGCALTTSSLSLSSSSSSIHQDEEGNCIFGQKSYWDTMYEGKVSEDDVISDYQKNNLRPSSSYSWYCGWEELKPFWNMLVSPIAAQENGMSDEKSCCHVLIAGIGNDPTPIDMYDDGWGSTDCENQNKKINITAYDYSEAGTLRAKELFGTSRNENVNLVVADARDLPLEDASIDATLDKGTFDAIYITGTQMFLDSIQELTRITAKGGIVMCISRVIDPDILLDAFSSQINSWEIIHDGTLAFAPDGEATIDLGAELYSWKRI